METPTRIFTVLSQCDFFKDALGNDSEAGNKIRITTTNFTKAFNMLDFWRAELMSYMLRNGFHSIYNYTYNWGDHSWRETWTNGFETKTTKVDVVMSELVE